MHRVIYVVALGVVAAAAAVAIRPGGDRGRSARDVREIERRAEFAAVAERTQARVALIVSLLRGELTLPQAVIRFRDILCEDPVGLRALQAHYPWATIEELATHQMVGYLGRHGDENPTRRDELVRQLSAPTVRPEVSRAATLVTLP